MRIFARASEICFVSEADIGISLAVSVFYLLQVILEIAFKSDHQSKDNLSYSDVCYGIYFDKSSGKDASEMSYVNPVRVLIGETFHSAAIWRIWRNKVKLTVASTKCFSCEVRLSFFDFLCHCSANLNAINLDSQIQKLSNKENSYRYICFLNCDLFPSEGFIAVS